MLGGNAPEWRNGTGEVVGLTLDGHYPVVIELDAARVILEGRNNQRVIDFCRRVRKHFEQP